MCHSSSDDLELWILVLCALKQWVSKKFLSPSMELIHPINILDDTFDQYIFTPTDLPHSTKALYFIFALDSKLVKDDSNSISETYITTEIWLIGR